MRMPEFCGFKHQRTRYLALTKITDDGSRAQAVQNPCRRSMRRRNDRALLAGALAGLVGWK